MKKSAQKETGQPLRHQYNHISLCLLEALKVPDLRWTAQDPSCCYSTAAHLLLLFPSLQEETGKYLV
jgi:hypothetical protein